jgi:hypothetical protein
MLNPTGFLTNPAQDTVAKAGNELARGANVTASLEGNPTNSFAPKQLEVPRLPQAHTNASYSVARQARRGGIAGLTPGV